MFPMRPLGISLTIIAVLGALIAFLRLSNAPPSTLPTPISEPVSYTIELVAQNLEVPWSIVFTSHDRILITERPGRVRAIEQGVLLPEPLLTILEVSSESEEGLMGLALDPDYASNSYVYLSYAYQNNNALAVKVVRYVDTGNALTQASTILDDIPAAEFHAGSRLRFGSDGKLYITTGDATERSLAQDQQSLAGKILRINPDGTIPSDNPFPDSLIYSLGHRNPQGIDWHPKSGALYATEHGPSGNDGPQGGDEINHIIAGANYGWPEVSHERTALGFTAPSRVYTPAIAPASGVFYNGDTFPQYAGNFFFGMLRGEGVMRVVLSEDGNTIGAEERLPGIAFGRIRDVAVGLDGHIYFSTSNRDGRGEPRDYDDAIYKLVPTTPQE